MPESPTSLPGPGFDYSPVGVADSPVAYLMVGGPTYDGSATVAAKYNRDGLILATLTDADRALLTEVRDLLRAVATQTR